MICEHDGPVPTMLNEELDRWENNGGLEAMTTTTQVREGLSEAAGEPFPDVSAGGRRWHHLALSRSIDTRTPGKYRTAPMEPSTCLDVFDVTLFGATCAKIEMIWRRRLEWSDYLMAMKRAIERELGYRQNRREARTAGGSGHDRRHRPRHRLRADVDLEAP